MVRINSQGAGFRELAHKVLSWIIRGKRPLTTLELQHAIAVNIGSQKIDEDDIPDIEDMVSACAGLVTVDVESGIIRLVHYTTQEYFRRTWNSLFPNAETDIARTCITYLSYDVFEAGYCSTEEEFEARLQDNVLYDYAARNWGYHTYGTPCESDDLLIKFLKSGPKTAAASQAMEASPHYRSYGYGQMYKTVGVHFAARFGLQHAIRILRIDQVELDTKDPWEKTPLQYAAQNGHKEVALLLLESKRVNPNAQDQLEQTALSVAAENGHEAVVELLLGSDQVNPDTKDWWGQTALSWAAKNGHEAVVKLLLASNKVDPNTSDSGEQTVLSLAAENGHEAVVGLLLASNKVNLTARDIWGETAQSQAAENGHEAVVKLLQAHCSAFILPTKS